jgi:chromate transporter
VPADGSPAPPVSPGTAAAPPVSPGTAAAATRPDPAPAPTARSDPAAPPEPAPGLERPGSPLQLFIAFTLLGLQGFGGVLAVAQRGLCEQRRWLTRHEFVEILSIGQLLPGPNVCNLALIIGDRFFGTRGAFAALGGLMVLPTVIVLSLTALYSQWSDLPQVAGALRGMAVVAAGITVGTALRLAGSLRPGPLGGLGSIAFAVATFVLVALMRAPLVWTLVGLGSLAVGIAWLRLARR